MFRERLLHYARLAGVIFLHLRDMLVVKSRRQRASQKLLQQVRRAEIVIALDALVGREERFGQNAEAEARAGRERLAVSAGVNNAFRRARQRERGRWNGRDALLLADRQVSPTRKRQFAIRGVFEQINRMSGGALEYAAY